MTYVLVVMGKADRQLSRLPNAVEERLTEIIETLPENPRPSGCKKLKDIKAPDGLPIWCIRDGRYRILYTIKRPVKENKRKKRRAQDGIVSVYQAWHRSKDYKEDAA